MRQQWFLISLLIVVLLVQVQGKDDLRERRLLAQSEFVKKACTDEGLDPKEGLFTDSEEKTFLSQKKKLVNKDEGNVFEEFFINSDSTKAIEIATKSFIVPVILMGIILVFTFPLGYFCYYCCACGPDKCCPPCKCCCPNKCCCIQCDQKEPYAGFSKAWPFIGMFAFLLWILICAIIGLAFTSGIEKSYKKFRCSMLNFMDETTQGDGAKWGGLSKMSTRMTEFKTQLGSLQTSVTSLLKGCDNATPVYTHPMCLKTQFDAFELTVPPLAINLNATDIALFNSATTGISTNTIFDAGFQYKVAYSPKVASPAASYSGIFSANRGKNGQISYYNLIKAELEAIKTGTISGMKQTLENIASNGASLTDTGYSGQLQDGITTINNQIKEVDGKQKDLFDATDTPLPYLAYITMALNAIFGAFLGLSILLILVGAIIFYFDKPKLRLILHLCWMLFTLITFIGMALSLILFTVNGAGFAFCDYVGYKVFKWDQTTFDSTNPEWNKLNDKLFKLSGTGKSLMEACFESLGGNGDILTPLGVKSQLDSVSGITDELNIGKEFSTQLTGVATTITSKLNVLISVFENNRFTYDSATDQVEHNDLAAAIANMNIVTAAQTDPDDVWYFFKPTSFTFTNAQINNFNDDAKKEIWLQQTYESAFATATCLGATCANDKSIQTTTTRITNFYLSGAPDTAIEALLKYRQAKDSVVLGRLKVMTEYQTAFAAIKTKIDSAVTNINSFKTSADSTLAILTHPTTGILGTDSTNCYFVGKQINNSLKAVCWGFFSALYQINESLIFISVGLSFASFFMCCTAMRVSKNDKLKSLKISTNVKTGTGK